jgi:hypothetical protein
MLSRLKAYEDEGVFGPEDVRALTVAFDDAWNAVQNSGVPLASNGQAEATRELLAIRIIEMARLGERDPHRVYPHNLIHALGSLRNWLT